MKKITILLFIMIILMSVQASANYLGIKKASEFISIPLMKPIDSSGWPGQPDSVHIITYADNASAKAFSTRSTTFPFSDISIDTTKDYGDTCYFFVDQIQDIDGAGGNFLLSIIVKLWYDKIPTTTTSTVQVIGDSLNTYFTDSVIVDVSSAMVTDGLLAVAADTVWEEINTGATHNTATSTGRQLRQLANAGIIADGTAQVSGTPTDAGTYLILASATSEADDFFNHAIVTIEGGTGIGQARAIFDYTGSADSAALHESDDWIVDPDATSKYIISPGAPVEVMHLHAEAKEDVAHGTWGHADTTWTAATMGDQLTDQSDTNKLILADVVNIDAWDPILDNDSLIIDQSSLEDMTVATVTNEVTADMTKISGDATAANNLETMLDGTGGQIFSLRGLHVRATTDNDTAIIAWGQTAGQGFNILGGSIASGLKVEGFTNSPAFNIKQAEGGAGLLITGNGGGGNAHGVQIAGGSDGKDILLGGTNKVISDGTNNVMMTNSYAINAVVEDSTGNTTTRIQTSLAEATDNHYNGMLVHFVDGAEAVTARRITDYDGTNGWIVYDPATTGTPATGVIIRISDWASVSATATISDADMGAIADSVHDKDTTDAFAVANGFGKFVKDSTQGAAAGITKESVADCVMDSLEAGTARDIQFKSLVISNSAGDAVQFTSTGNDGDGLQLTGESAGAGLRAIGGSGGTGIRTAGSGIGYGIWASGGATNAAGFYSAGQGTGAGIYARGGSAGSGILAEAQTSGHGIYAIGATAGHGIYAIAGGSGSGAYFYGGPTNGVGLYAAGQGAGPGIYSYGGPTAHGMLIQGQTNGNGLKLQAAGNGKDLYLAGSGTISNTSSHVFMENEWTRIHSKGAIEDSSGNTTTMVQTSLSESTNDHYNNMAIIFYTGDEAGQMRPIKDYVGASGVITWDDALTGIPVDPDSFIIYPWTTVMADNLPTGPDTITYYASDTLGPDVHVSDVSIWMKTMSGQDYGGAQLTNTGGNITLLGFTGDTLLIFARKLGYGWEPDTLIFAAQGKDSLMGYDVIIGTPGGPSTVRCYGYAYDAEGNAVQGVIPTYEMKGGSVEDTCNNVPIVIRKGEGIMSNAAGYWYIDLTVSMCLSNYNKYKIGLNYGRATDFIFNDTLPGDKVGSTFRVTKYQ